MVHWIIGKLYAKYKGGLNSRDDKGLNKPFMFFSKHAYKDGYCGLYIEVIITIKRDVLWLIGS